MFFIFLYVFCLFHGIPNTEEILVGSYGYECVLITNLYIQWADNIMMNHLKVTMTKPMLHIPFAACEEVIHNYNFMALHH